MTDISIPINLLLVPLLLAVILYDLRFMKLPNRLAILFVILFLATAPVSMPLDVMGWRIGIAIALLLVGMAANAAGLLGGGDVKILSAFALFIPRQDLLSFTYILCLCMIVGIIGLLLLRRVLDGRGNTWRGLQKSGRYPMGISIGAAGLIQVLWG